MSSNLARQERSLSTPLTTAASPDFPELPPAATQEVASRISDLPQDEVHTDSSEDVEVLQASIRAGSVAQIIVAVIAVIGLIYLLKLVLVTTLASLLLAFILEPLVGGLARMRIPRQSEHWFLWS